MRTATQIWPHGEIRGAASGSEAIDLLDWRPEVILLDLLMPEVNGLDVLQAVRDRKYLEATHIIAVTARGPAERLTATAESEVHVLRNGGLSATEVVRFIELLTGAMPPHYAGL
jgi:CheY-like chemotaxis protein